MLEFPQFGWGPQILPLIWFSPLKKCGFLSKTSHINKDKDELFVTQLLIYSTFQSPLPEPVYSCNFQFEFTVIRVFGGPSALNITTIKVSNCNEIQSRCYNLTLKSNRLFDISQDIAIVKMQPSCHRIFTSEAAK